MPKDADLKRVLDLGLVAIIRAPSGEQLVKVSEALLEGGIDVIEVTFTVPGILDILKEVRTALGDRILLGAGTVLDTESARAAILAGAEYLVTPTVNVDVIKLCQRYGKLCMAGAFTPTEILTAWEAGADIVKVFPADIGGPDYLKSIHGPLPQIRLLPTGGVNLETLGRFVKAGACAVGLGSALVEKKALEERNMARITELSRAYVSAMAQARAV
ncbi:MAG: bifunctional 4-hydroxy-2-oxoglutarate aldolase/2-dehydro-3-deoxy-phosphogluconate aldolase [Planctomycetaceae bacterium]|nr:bifunctional 4-hydroxy-2-oxoglutarate aldolase/2-dehydro-3-deoxy-phosphogluconate aldolase [Planctomycetaceae bacterium]